MIEATGMTEKKGKAPTSEENIYLIFVYGNTCVWKRQIPLNWLYKGTQEVILEPETVAQLISSQCIYKKQ